MEITEEKIIEWIKAVELSIMDQQGRLNALTFMLNYLKTKEKEKSPEVIDGV